jgi:hypothetical protein
LYAILGYCKRFRAVDPKNTAEMILYKDYFKPLGIYCSNSIKEYKKAKKSSDPGSAAAFEKGIIAKLCGTGSEYNIIAGMAQRATRLAMPLKEANKITKEYGEGKLTPEQYDAQITGSYKEFTRLFRNHVKREDYVKGEHVTLRRCARELISGLDKIGDDFRVLYNLLMEMS